MSDQSLYLLTEAAERTGLTVEAIRQRIKRGKLDAVKGNDGLLRFRLTTADLEALDRSPTGQAAQVCNSAPRVWSVPPCSSISRPRCCRARPSAIASGPSRRHSSRSTLATPCS